MTMGITPLPLIFLGQGGGIIIAEIPIGLSFQDGPILELTFTFLVICVNPTTGFCWNPVFGIEIFDSSSSIVFLPLVALKFIFFLPSKTFDLPTSFPLILIIKLSSASDSKTYWPSSGKSTLLQRNIQVLPCISSFGNAFTSWKSGEIKSLI